MRTPVVTTNATSMPELVRWGQIVDPVDRWWTPLNSWQFLPDVRGIVEALEQPLRTMAVSARQGMDDANCAGRHPQRIRVEQRCARLLVAADAPVGQRNGGGGMIGHLPHCAHARIQFPDLVNLYGCEVADNCVVRPFVEIQAGVSVGATARSNRTFICTGVSIGADVFVGHGVTFTNDLYPVIDSTFVMRGCIVGRGVSIGSGVTILPVVIGVHSIIGAGAVVCDDLPPLCVAVGNPAGHPAISAVSRSAMPTSPIARVTICTPMRDSANKLQLRGAH